MIAHEADTRDREPMFLCDPAHRLVFLPQVDTHLTPAAEPPVFCREVVRQREVEPEILPHPVGNEIDPGREDPQPVPPAQRFDRPADPNGVRCRQDGVGHSRNRDIGEEFRIPGYPLGICILPREILAEESVGAIGHAGCRGNRSPTRFEFDAVIANESSVKIEDDRVQSRHARVLR